MCFYNRENNRSWRLHESSTIPFLPLNVASRYGFAERYARKKWSLWMKKDTTAFYNHVRPNFRIEIRPIESLNWIRSWRFGWHSVEGSTGVRLRKKKKLVNAKRLLLWSSRHDRYDYYYSRASIIASVQTEDTGTGISTAFPSILALNHLRGRIHNGCARVAAKRKRS